MRGFGEGRSLGTGDAVVEVGDVGVGPGDGWLRCDRVPDLGFGPDFEVMSRVARGFGLGGGLLLL